MQTAPERCAPDEAEQDDPKNVEAIERLCARLARHEAHAEKLAQTLRQEKSKA